MKVVPFPRRPPGAIPTTGRRRTRARSRCSSSKRCAGAERTCATAVRQLPSFGYAPPRDFARLLEGALYLAVVVGLWAALASL